MTNSEYLSQADEIRHLVIWMDSSMKFSMECSDKAMQALGKFRELLNTLHNYS